MEDKSTKKLIRLGFWKGAAVTALCFVALYVLSIWLPIGGSPKTPDSIQTYRKIREIEHIIENHYLGDIDEQKQTDTLYLGLVSGLGDPYSTYYTEKEYESVQKTQQGSFVGIGITIVKREEDQLLEIVGVTENSPAEKAGVQAGDLVQSINGTDVTDYTSSQAVELIQQSTTDVITLELIREGETDPLTIMVEKDIVELVSVSSEMLDEQVGYIRISTFTGVTSDQFAAAYADLEAQGMKKLVLDLRDNTGGLVDAACDVGRQLLPEGVIVYTEDRDGNREERTCDGTSEIDIPLVVLVNGNTASASEILAGAIQDYDIGTLVGATTFGKGIVQNIFRLTDGSVLKLTVSHYYTPKGNDIHGSGIMPDIKVEQSDDSDKDAQLEQALQTLALQ